MIWKKSWTSFRFITCSTINNLLWWKLNEPFLHFEEVFSFNRRGFCDSPRCLTWCSLISYWIYSSFWPPVEFLTDVFNIKISWLFIIESLWLFKFVPSKGFWFCHSWEYVVPNLELILTCINLINFGIFFCINLKSELILFFCFKSKSVFLNVLDEVLLKKWDRFLAVLASVVFISNQCEGFAK